MNAASGPGALVAMKMVAVLTVGSTRNKTERRQTVEQTHTQTHTQKKKKKLTVAW